MEIYNDVLPGTTSSHSAASAGTGCSSSAGPGCTSTSGIPHVHTAYRPEGGAGYWPDILPQGATAACCLKSVAVTYVKYII